MTRSGSYKDSSDENTDSSTHNKKVRFSVEVKKEEKLAEEEKGQVAPQHQDEAQFNKLFKEAMDPQKLEMFRLFQVSFMSSILIALSQINEICRLLKDYRMVLISNWLLELLEKRLHGIVFRCFHHRKNTCTSTGEHIYS